MFLDDDDDDDDVVRRMKILGDSGAADDPLDPVSESGDASVDAIVVRTPAAFAPAHHPGQEPATGRLLANQGATRVSLTGIFLSTAVAGAKHSGSDQAAVGLDAFFLTDQANVHLLEHVTGPAWER